MSETPKFENLYTKEQTEQQEQIKKLESNDQNLVKLDKNIKKIEDKLSKLGDKGTDFFQKIMNDYLKEKYGAYFEQKDGHLILIVDKQQKDYIQKLDELTTRLKVNGNDIFVDKDGNNKMDKDEMGLKINEKEKKLETNAIYVDKKELKNKSVSFGKIDNDKQGKILDKEYTHGGGLIYKNGKVYYQVGEPKDKDGNYDHLSAVSRLFTALSEEFFDGMNLKEINKKIENLYFNPKTNEFKIFDNGKPEPGYEKVGNINSKKWWSIVKPGAIINMSSLAEAISPKPKQSDQNKIDSKETENVLEGWGRFYTGANGEVWDVPDSWKKIDYKGYSSSYSNLTGEQISIGAKSLYDVNDKEKGKSGKNTFSFKDEIILKDGTKAFLLIGETGHKDKINQIKKNTTESEIRTALKDSFTEAWLVTKGKDGKVTIKEVGDKRVHTVTETSDKVERGEDKDHPIILSGENGKYEYKFSGSLEGSLKIEQKDGEYVLNSDAIKSKEDFAKVFASDKVFLQCDDKILKVTFDKGLKISETYDAPKVEFSGIGVNIFGNTFSGFEYDKDSKYISFPEIKGWGKISGHLEKNDGELIFGLDKQFKIGDKEVKIDLGKVDDSIKPDEILQKTVDGLMLLAVAPDNDVLAKHSGRGLYKIKDDELVIKYDNLPKNKDISDALEFVLKINSKQNKENYIFEGIKKEIEKKLDLRETSTKK